MRRERSSKAAASFAASFSSRTVAEAVAVTCGIGLAITVRQRELALAQTVIDLASHHDPSGW
jgi:hypothetical protein